MRTLWLSLWRCGAAVMLLLTALCSEAAWGAEWTSPAGVLAVTAPDSQRFDRVEQPPEPFLVLWVSKDESIRLGVIRMPIPAQASLTRQGVEEGFAEEIRGTIAASSMAMQNGHEILIMSAKGAMDAE